MSASYRIRRGGGTPGRPAYGLNVPSDLAEALRERFVFTLEVTDEGLLYRPVPLDKTGSTVLPAWAKVSS